MKDRRYLVVLMDARGRSLRRVALRRRSIVGALGILSISCCVAVGLLTHGIVRQQTAVEARALAVENAELSRLNTLIDSRITASRQMATRAELTFAQLWSKSGLGPEPTALGVGPTERGDDEAPGTPYSSHIRSLELLEVPLELDRLSIDGPHLQSSLDELLEYFHDAERLLSNTPSTKPAGSPWQTSSFGRRRDPMTGQWLMHKGIDLGGRTGDPIYAPADGVVIFVGRRGGYGLTIVVDHGFGIQTHYAHLSRYRVHLGERVERGRLIADMGTTGKSTGPHLHYEVRRMGQPLDPEAFIMD